MNAARYGMVKFSMRGIGGIALCDEPASVEPLTRAKQRRASTDSAIVLCCEAKHHFVSSTARGGNERIAIVLIVPSYIPNESCVVCTTNNAFFVRLWILIP